MMPEGKLTVAREMADMGDVMMIGDDINDVPALKQTMWAWRWGLAPIWRWEQRMLRSYATKWAGMAAVIRLSQGNMANIRQNVTLALRHIGGSDHRRYAVFDQKKVGAHDPEMSSTFGVPMSPTDPVMVRGAIH